MYINDMYCLISWFDESNAFCGKFGAKTNDAGKEGGTDQKIRE
jgi:hypothetical protein